MKEIQRIVSFLLAMVMVIGMVPPMAVRAEETDPTQAVEETVIPDETNTEVPVMSTVSGITSETQTASSDAMRSSAVSGTCGENLTWTLDDGGTLTISGTGEMGFFNFSDEVPWYSYARSITEVSLPKGLGSIGRYAFAYCRNLKSITIPESVYIIYSNAFLYSGITSLTIPKYVADIDFSCFQACYDLEEIRVDPENAYYCSVDGIMFSKDLSTLHYYPCGMSAESYAVPDDVTTIGEQAFMSCANLKRIELPAELTTIGFGAFLSANLEAILIPASVEKIESYAFEACEKLSHVYYTGTAEQWNALIENGLGDDNAPLLNAAIHYDWDGSGIPENPDPTVPPEQNEPTEPEDDTIRGVCGDNLSWTLQDNVLTISGSGAMTDFAYDGAPWYGNTVLEVVLPEGLTRIGSYAFQSSLISSIDIPQTVQEIGQGAFFYCDKLKRIEIPTGITGIAKDTFGYCKALTSILIPESVSNIGVGAFYYCSSLKNIDIPEGITSIANNTFYHCNGLIDIQIPDGVKDIGSGAFNQCSALTEIEIPASVKSIGEMAFMGCESLVSLVIPEGVTAIKGSTFSSCKKLESVSIPSSVSAIGTAAFSGCAVLKTVSIPKGVTAIDGQAFQSCSSLESITISNSVTSIGHSVFSGCSSLANITIPNSVTSIGSNLFTSCSSLVNVVISNGLTEIPYYTFNNCTALNNVVIPDTITRIGNGAFKNCSSLTDIKIPSGMTWIDSETFSGCTSLTGVEIPSNIFSIGSKAFYNCSGLKHITVSSDLYMISSEVFFGCSNLTDVYYSGTEEQWKSLLQNTNSTQNPPLFSDMLTVHYNGEGVPEEPEVPEEPPLPGAVIASGACDAYLTWTLDSAGLLTISGEGMIPCCDYWTNAVNKEQVNYIVVESGVTQLGNAAFHEMNNVLAIYLPETLFYIHGHAFMNCSSLVQLKIPDSVVAIGESAFSGCSALKQLSIPAGVSHIGQGAFFACDALETIAVSKENGTFKAVDGILFTKNGKSLIAVPECHPDVISGSYAVPDGVESIASHAFSEAWRLTEVSLPASLMQIGYNSFYFLGNLKDIHYSGTETMWERLMENTEEHNDSLQSAAVHFGNESAATPDLPETIVAQGVSGGLRWILDANGLLTISGSGAMQNYIHAPWTEFNPQIKAVVIEGGITNIGENAFARSFEGLDNAITEVTVPTSVGIIETGAFGGCAELTAADLPGVKIILDGAFAECTSLVFVDMPESMLYIGESAFENCTALEQVDIPAGITVMENHSFAGCTGLTGVTMPDSVTRIKAHAFYGCTGLSNVSLPDDLMWIEQYAFSGCSGLGAVVIPERTVSIAAFAFSDCSSLSSLTTYDGLLDIGDSAFYNCALGSANIPITTTYVGKMCFAGNPELNIRYAGTMEQWRGICVTSTPAHCSDGTITAWGTCGDKLEWTLIQDTLRIFGTGDMYDYKGYAGDTPRSDPEWDSYMSQIHYVIVEDDVTSVGNYAFYKHDSIRSAILGDDVKSIGQDAFYMCEAMTQIVLPDKLFGIGSSAFAYTGLTSVTIPYLVSDIPAYAFFASKLETVVLSSVWSVGTYAFASNPIQSVYFFSDEDRWNAIEFADGDTPFTTKPNMYFNSFGPGNIAGIQAGMIVMSEDSSMSVRSGHGMILSVGIYDFGAWLEDLSGITIQVANPSILSVRSVDEKDSHKYFTLQGHNPGTTTVTFSDSNTGYTAQVSITVYEQYTNIYTVENVPTQYFEGLATNIYNLGGLYVSNYRYYPSGDGSTSVYFDAYNTNCVYGFVEVFDSSGKLVDAVVLGKMNVFKTSIKELVWDETAFIIQNIANDTLGTYQESGHSCKTSVGVNIPPNGYIRITSDPTVSGVAAVVNLTNLVMSSGGVVSAVAGYDANADNFATSLTAQLVKDKAFEKLTEDGSNLPKELAKKVAKDTFIQKASMDSSMGIILQSLHELNLDETISDAAAGYGWELGEDLLLYFAGPIGAAIEVIFGVGKVANVVMEWADYTASHDSGYIYIQNQLSNFRSSQQITVESQTVLPKDTALRVFTISLDEKLLEGLEIVDPGLYKAVAEGTVYTYDISLVRDGVEVQPNGSVSVSIPIPEELKIYAEGGCAYVYRIEENGSLTRMNAKVTGDCFVFNTEHFSLYTIVGEELGSSVERRITVHSADLDGQTSVWIDGAEYTVLKDGDVCYIDLPDGNAKTMVSVIWNEDDSNDIHTQYPISMKVWTLKNENGFYTATRVEELDNILQYSGSSIRVTGKQGIRMITSIDKSKKDSLISEGLAGFTLKEYGTVVAWASQLEGGKPLVLGKSYAKFNYAYKKGIADPVFAYDGNLMQYTNVLVGFNMEQCKNDIAMRSYMILTDAEGNDITLYGGIVQRSIGYIAAQNANTFAPETDAYNYVWNIIRHVYGESYVPEAA